MASPSSAHERDPLERIVGPGSYPSRAAVLERAVSLLPVGRLGAEYGAAWSEWETSEGMLWDEHLSEIRD